MDPDFLLVAFLIVLIAISASTESAILSTTPAQVRALVEAKRRGAVTLSKLKHHAHKTLITILVWSTFVTISASTVTTAVMTRYFSGAGVGLSTAILTVVILIFGEIIPKAIGTTYAKNLALFIAPFLYSLGILLTPITVVLDFFVNQLLKLLGAEHPIKVTDEELIAMASIGAEEGSIEKHELEWIENALEFNDIQVDGIMTPRIHIDGLPETYDLDDAAEFIVNHTHTRIPVYRENIDHIVGILSVKELLKQYHQQEKPNEITLRQINLMTPLKIQHSLSIRDLFHLFKRKHMHMAIVLDEHGGTAGLVTMEDLLEELVGDIEDEEDTEERVIKLGRNHFELSGRAELDELAELTGLEFEYPEYKTVSFLINEKLGSLAQEGQKIVLGKWQFTVTKMLRNTILKVQLKKLA